MLIQSSLNYSGVLSLLGKFSEALAYVQKAEAIAQQEGNTGLLNQAKQMHQHIEEMFANEKKAGQ